MTSEPHQIREGEIDMNKQLMIKIFGRVTSVFWLSLSHHVTLVSLPPLHNHVLFE